MKLQEQAQNGYINLSEEEYGRNRWEHMSKEDKQKLKGHEKSYCNARKMKL